MHMGRALNIYLDITVMKLRDLKIHNFSKKHFMRNILCLYLTTKSKILSLKFIEIQLKRNVKESKLSS
jgi:hypothetical protein